MALRLYDTRTATIRDFEPLEPGRVSLYYCGATVQGAPHTGHLRSAVVFDILIRWLQYSGLRVSSVRNVTDIDDKILEKSAASYQPGFTAMPHYPAEDPWHELAYRFEGTFNRAYAAVGVQPPHYEPRATGHIPEMIALISRLIENGHAYPAGGKSSDVYFDVGSWPAYGELTHQSAENMQAAPDADTHAKRDPRDFVLWKGRKAHEPLTASWDSPWGPGRPGWHIECSAMATKYLGAQFDIHGGGLDLRFPHHENELAQSRAAGDTFARFWLHNGLVTADGEKMSKSLGNTVDPAQMLDNYPAVAVRYFLGQAHYRSQLDYSEDSLREAQAAATRCFGFVERARKHPDVGTAEVQLLQVPAAFAEAMDDDLNVPAALAVLHTTVRAGNAALNHRSASAESLVTYAIQVQTMLEVLGLAEVHSGESSTAESQKTALDRVVTEFLNARTEAKTKKDYAQADAIRERLAAAGIQIDDTPTGSQWSFTASQLKKEVL